MTADPPTPRAVELWPQCQATVYVRDTYRRTGGRPRFRMHYARQQCSRRATKDGYCWQHAAIDLVTPKEQA